MTRRRKIKEFPGYKVSETGVVWTCWSTTRPSVMTDTYRKLKLSPLHSGHLQVSLTKNGKLHHKKVHRLVLEAFVGSCPKGMEGRHFPDRDPTNNNLSNLSWGTHSQNMRDRTVHGTGNAQKGQDHWKAKLTEKDVRKIRRMRKKGMRLQHIADIFGINHTNVNFIVKRVTWRHI